MKGKILFKTDLFRSNINKQQTTTTTTSTKAHFPVNAFLSRPVFNIFKVLINKFSADSECRLEILKSFNFYRKLGSIINGYYQL